MQSKAKTNYRWLLQVAAIKLRGCAGGEGGVMKCIQLNNPRSNKMPNVFISTATLDARDQASKSSQAKAKQSTYPTRSSKCMQNVYINEPTQQMHTHTHTQTHVYIREKERDRRSCLCIFIRCKCQKLLVAFIVYRWWPKAFISY